MTTRNKRKLAALNKENCEEHPRSNLVQNSSAPRSQEDYITQFSEEIEGRVIKRLSKEFSRTENRILGALARLDDFLMNPLLPGHSGTTPEPSRNALKTSQGTNEDDSQNNPRPEADLFHGQITQNSGPEDGRDMVTGVTEDLRNRRDMVTGVQREREREKESAATTWWQEPQKRMGIATTWWQELQNRLVIATIWLEFTRKSHTAPPSTSSGKQKKNRSTSQPQFRRENTTATIEADQILLALQQLANNNNSANFYDNINRISKLPKSLTTTMPTFDGKTEKFELFEDLFQTSLKINNQLTEDDRINHFHSLMRGDALQTFKNINGPTRENLEERSISVVPLVKLIKNLKVYAHSNFTFITQICSFREKKSINTNHIVERMAEVLQSKLFSSCFNFHTFWGKKWLRREQVKCESEQHDRIFN